MSLADGSPEVIDSPLDYFLEGVQRNAFSTVRGRN